MKCDKAQEFFSDYIENALDRPMTVALETHLNGCEACRADVAGLRDMWTVLDKLPQVEPPADFVWRTTTRLQNELLNRREAERARALPWWKRMTPVMAFSCAGVAALLVIGLMAPIVPTKIGPTRGWDFFEGLIHRGNQPVFQPLAAPVTPPQFMVQVPGPGGEAALVTITASSDVAGAGVAMGYLLPTPTGLATFPRRVGHPSNWSTGHSETVAVQRGGAHAAEFRVFSGAQVIADKMLLLPGAAPLAGPLQNADPYVALQQIANRTGQAMLVDAGLKTPVTLDPQSIAPQQALESVLAQVGAQRRTEATGVLEITK